MIPTAANRLTISGWDLVSKQPHFKYAAVALRPVRRPPVLTPEGAGAAVAGSNGDRPGTGVPVGAGVPSGTRGAKP